MFIVRSFAKNVKSRLRDCFLHVGLINLNVSTCILIILQFKFYTKITKLMKLGHIENYSFEGGWVHIFGYILDYHVDNSIV